MHHFNVCAIPPLPPAPPPPPPASGMAPESCTHREFSFLSCFLLWWRTRLGRFGWRRRRREGRGGAVGRSVNRFCAIAPRRGTVYSTMSRSVMRCHDSWHSGWSHRRANATDAVFLVWGVRMGNIHGSTRIRRIRCVGESLLGSVICWVGMMTSSFTSTYSELTYGLTGTWNLTRPPQQALNLIKPEQFRSSEVPTRLLQ